MTKKEYEKVREEVAKKYKVRISELESKCNKLEHLLALERVEAAKLKGELITLSKTVEQLREHSSMSEGELKKHIRETESMANATSAMEGFLHLSSKFRSNF